MKWRDLRRAVFRTSPAFSPQERADVVVDNVIASAALDGVDPDSLERDRELLRSVIRGERTVDEAIDLIMAELVADGIVPPDWEQRGK